MKMRFFGASTFEIKRKKRQPEILLHIFDKERPSSSCHILAHGANVCTSFREGLDKLVADYASFLCQYPTFDCETRPYL